MATTEELDERFGETLGDIRHYVEKQSEDTERVIQRLDQVIYWLEVIASRL